MYITGGSIACHLPPHPVAQAVLPAAFHLTTSDRQVPARRQDHTGLNGIHRWARH